MPVCMASQVTKTAAAASLLQVKYGKFSWSSFVTNHMQDCLLHMLRLMQAAVESRVLGTDMRQQYLSHEPASWQLARSFKSTLQSQDGLAALLIIT